MALYEVEMRKASPRSILVAASLALVGCVAAAFAATRAPAAQYNVLFSRDDKLCATLRDFYNRHLFDVDSPVAGYIEDQFGRDLRPMGVEFASERENWQPPNALTWIQVLPPLDFYHQGSLRKALLIDRGNDRFSSFATQVLILKPEVEVIDKTQFANRLEFSTDPRVEQRIDFSRGGSSIAPSEPYLIREITQPIGKTPTGRNIPAGIGRAGQRVLRYENRIYGVARERLDRRIDPFIDPNERESFVRLLVYSVPNSGIITNICFMQLHFTLQR
jgi:hypothetical protein